MVDNTVVGELNDVSKNMACAWIFMVLLYVSLHSIQGLLQMLIILHDFSVEDFPWRLGHFYRQRVGHYCVALGEQSCRSRIRNMDIPLFFLHPLSLVMSNVLVSIKIPQYGRTLSPIKQGILVPLTDALKFTKLLLRLTLIPYCHA